MLQYGFPQWPKSEAVTTDEIMKVTPNPKH